MVNEHFKKCWTSLSIKEMQIKATVWFHFILIRMSKIKETNGTTCYKKMEHFFVGGFNANLYATMKIAMEIPQEAKNLSASITTCTTIEHIPKGLLMLLQRHLLNRFHCCSIHNSQKVEPTNDNEKWYIYPMGIIQLLRKKLWNLQLNQWS